MGPDEKHVDGLQSYGDRSPSPDDGVLKENSDDLQRHLGNRQIQLIAIGGSIGTALFISIGGALNKAGPGGMFIAYTSYSLMMALVNNCIAEMTVHMPVTGGFVRLAGKWVDDAFGFMAGWNFFYEALLIPFEITAINLVLTFWRDDIPVAAVCAACIVLYAYVLIPVATVTPSAQELSDHADFSTSLQLASSVKPSSGCLAARSF